MPEEKRTIKGKVNFDWMPVDPRWNVRKFLLVMDFEQGRGPAPLHLQISERALDDGEKRGLVPRSHYRSSNNEK